MLCPEHRPEVSDVEIWEHDGDPTMLWYTMPDGECRFRTTIDKADGFSTITRAEGIVAMGIDRFVVSAPATNKIYFSDICTIALNRCVLMTLDKVGNCYRAFFGNQSRL